MKYWVYMNGEVPGCYIPTELVALPSFSNTTLVCPAEGEILEKNWRRAGEFPDLITLLHERDAQRPPALMPAPEPITADVNNMIDSASSRLFSHVADLMKELESRREERAMTMSVQRQLIELKDQLQREREKAASLEGRVVMIAELEDSLRKQQNLVSGLEAALKAREEGMSELRMALEKTRTEMEGSKRRLGEALNDLGIRNRLGDKISRYLTEKELSLAKALGVIRRLEEDLHRLVPGGLTVGASPSEKRTEVAPPLRAEPMSPPPPFPVPPAVESQPFSLPPPPPPPPPPVAEVSAPMAAAASAPAPAAAPEIPTLKPSDLLDSRPLPQAFTTDDPPPPPPPLEGPPPTGQPAAQGAIVEFFKKFTSKIDS